MGDRHGGRFARRGRALSLHRRGFPMAHCGFPMARGGMQDLPRAGTLPRRRPPDTAPERKDLPPRENAPHGESLPTRRTSERVCPAQERSPRRRPPETAHGRKDLPRAETLPRRRPPDTAHERRDLPRGVRVRPTCRRTAGRSRLTNSRKNTPSAGSHPRRRGRCRVHSPKK